MAIGGCEVSYCFLTKSKIDRNFCPEGGAFFSKI